MPIPVFLDFEASSLCAESYPIEVAWNNAQGEITSYLIRPEWNWTDWDYNAEQNIHHISREQLLAEGKPATWVAGEVSKALAGATTYSDNPAYDGFWLERLFEVTNEDPQIRIEHLILALGPKDYPGVIQRAQRKLNVPAHRAGNDVAVFVEAYRLSNGSTL